MALMLLMVALIIVNEKTAIFENAISGKIRRALKALALAVILLGIFYIVLYWK